MITLPVENNLKMAAIELLRKFPLLPGLLGDKPEGRIIRRRDLTTDAKYPCVWIGTQAFVEEGIGTGWYMGTLQLGAMTYRADDLDHSVNDRLLGALRAFAQQPDLATQLNQTQSAGSVESALDVRFVNNDQAAFDFSEERIQEQILGVSVLCRASRATTSTG